MDKCDVYERTIRYFDDELPEAERLVVERHLETCAACRAALDDLSLLSSAIRATYSEEPSTGAMAQARRGPQRHVERVSYGLLTAATVALVVSAAWSAYVTGILEEPSPVVNPWEEYAVTSLNPEDEILGRDPGLNVGAWMHRGLTREPDDE